MNRFILYFTTILLLTSCGTKDSQMVIDPLFGKLPEDLVKEIEKISPKIQSFNIDPSKDNSIISDSGTVIIVPSNTIVDQNGNNIKTEVIIKLKEHFSVSDYLLSNLQTVQNGDLLESGGMIHINAYDLEGSELKIASGKSIRIEIPNNGKINNPQIFLGKRNNEGMMNWGEIQTPNKSLAVYPILYISRHHLPPGYWTECPEFYGIVNSFVSEEDSYYYLQDNILKYEKTLLATKEFKERYDYYCQPELVKFYIDNLDKNLWEIDELFIKKLIQDSIENVEFEMKQEIVKNTPEMIKLHNSFIEDAKQHSHRYLEMFRTFAAQKHERVDKTILVDSSAFINYFNDVSSFTEYNNAFRTKVTINATRFGWVNLDVIYKDPRSIEMDIMVETSTPASTVTLILKDNDVLINAYPKGGNTSFSFTTPSEGYNKLPKGAKGILVAIGYEKDEVTFAMKEIVIGKSDTEMMSMKSISLQELEKKLKSL